MKCSKDYSFRGESLARRNVYLKLRRRGSFDFPILGVAATMEIDERGECRHASVVLTAVASAPKVVTEATTLLQGKKVTQELIDAVAEAAAKIAHPLDNADLDYWYRKKHGESVYAESAGAGGGARTGMMLKRLECFESLDRHSRERGIRSR